ncbi:DUF1302 family protein [Solimonas sp. K1W22B-7]|uniref:DUF1302 domain-containing protein n=1 Tax=Solimonas sp. K1W22B-7 TaxID=2303331 RepID=UPI000E331C44|nr:DUF1302 family protein [Solimonas sp. K1W22B-7]AXQ29767.1 DUF1302 family protein [Solimonas sp. K1W22B-7]
MKNCHKQFPRIVPALLALACAAPAQAITFDFADGEITGVLNTAITAGSAWRMEDRAADLVGKSNLDPDLCGGRYQSCQGLFKEQIYPAQHLAAAPGQFSMRNDDGNLNYDQGDMVQGVAKITQDLTLNWHGFGFFARWLAFHDFVNNDFTETHPNLITPENVERVATTGNAESNHFFTRVYGKGERVRSKRREGEVLNQVGSDLQWLDFNISGRLPLWGEKDMSFKIGRQTVNWGESTLMVINSVNQAQPVNANNLYRVGFTVEEVFTPVGSVFASMDLFENATLEAYYQFEWQPVEAPAPGSYFGFADIGTNNAVDNLNLTFGTSPDDPDRAFAGANAREQLGYLDNPLTLITPTTTTFQRGKDREASDQGQFGIAFKYYAENLGNGTELGFYFMNYHSKLPYVSFMSSAASCARAEGNALGINATSTSTFLQACPNVPVTTNLSATLRLTGDALALGLANPAILADLGLANLAGLGELLTGQPGQPHSNAIALDSPIPFFEYPENLKMIGFSFNTTLGDLSVQGEVAYRPDQPLQVAVTDLAFAALGPTLTRCHDQSLGCLGSRGGNGFDENGNFAPQYGSSDFTDANGNIVYRDTVNLLVGHVPGSARAFPNFVIPYRGGVVGENAPNSYIRGYEEFDTLQFNLGFTQVLGATDNPFGADQIQVVGEFGAVWVPNLPSLDQLQIEAPGVYTHASAGADGSGADGSQQACSTNPSCTVNYDANGDGDYDDEGDVFGDGLRFNPHQADLSDFVDKFSWGYKIITIVKYESVAPGISLQPFIVWSHDVNGTGPGPAENFVKGRKQVLANLETRYKEAISFTVGYGWFFGGGNNNLYRDRDFAQAFVRYQF